MINEFLGRGAGHATVGDWLVALAIVAGSIIASKLLTIISTKGVKRLLARAPGKLLYILVDMLEEPVAVGIVIIGFIWAERSLALGARVDLVCTKIVSFAVILDLTWAIVRLLDSLISAYLVPHVQKSKSRLDDQLLPIARKVTNIVIWLMGLVAAISDAGYNVGAIVAGLGIGGLAFAFAAQETIANLFGGVTIFIDAPFVIGDRIKVSGFEGWVREIGLRTSRLETLDGRRLTVPNSAFSKNVIENVSAEPATRVVETVSLAFSTPAESVEKSIDMVASILAADPGLERNSTVFFSDFDQASLNLSVVLWARKGADIGTLRTRVNLAILRAFAEAGIQLAIPARVVMQKT
jgi:MscS family membrane protein